MSLGLILSARILFSRLYPSSTLTAPHKGPGLDGIAPKFVKNGAPELAPIIIHIFNLPITTETVRDDGPDDLQSATIIPFYEKKKSRLDLGNYRPVSVLCCI